MQSVTNSWAEQSFSSARCSASRENKSRIRRTKEERRTMIMSFIKKYQTSNDGKFPSLNVTHKEVGGSFYIVREIVRDIIQENKVLGSGSLTSTLLSLEYFSEKEEDVDSFLIAGSKSISAVGNGIYYSHLDVDSTLEQVKDGETSFKGDFANESIQHDKLVNTGLTESDAFSLTAMDDNLRSSGHIHVEVQANCPADTFQYAKQSLSFHPTVSQTFLVESNLRSEDMHNKVSATTHSFDENDNVSETAVSESLPGTSLLFTDIVDDQPDCSESFVKGIETYSSELEIEGVNSTFNIPQTFNYTNKSKVPFSPLDKEIFTSSSHSDEISLFTSEGLEVLKQKCVAPGVSETKQFVDKSSCLVDALKESENASCKLLKPIIQEAAHSEIKTEKQSDALSTVRSECLISSSEEESSKESDISETNPLWAAIMEFISSFIKFWSD